MPRRWKTLEYWREVSSSFLAERSSQFEKIYRNCSLKMLTVIFWAMMRYISYKHWKVGQNATMYRSCIKCLFLLVFVIDKSYIYIYILYIWDPIYICIYVYIVAYAHIGTNIKKYCIPCFVFALLYWNMQLFISGLGFTRACGLGWTQRYTSKYFCFKQACMY